MLVMTSTRETMVAAAPTANMARQPKVGISQVDREPPTVAPTP